MDRAEVERIVAAGESATVELKKSTAELGAACETLCAFLNGGGGRVVIGVPPGSKRLVGQQVSDKTLQEVANALRELEPPAPIQVDRVEVPDTDRTLIILEARPAPESIPFTFRGRAYERIEATTSRMPQLRYQQLLLDRAHAQTRWENQPAEGVALEDLDPDEILRTFRGGIAEGRIPESTVKDPADVLDRLELRAGGRILNAAVVLFARRPFPRYPQCELRMARFRGIDKTEFIDNRQVHGNALVLLDEAMLFMQRHLPVAGRIPPGSLVRKDEPLFPLAALREAVVNAICHRDYSHQGGAISIAIYDDRLEVWSDGLLPFGMRVEELKRDHPSKPRNRLIAGVLYRRGLIEHWGRGTQMIVELCVKAGHPEPIFLEQAGSVVVRFLPRAYIAPHRVSHDLTERQREILEVLSVPGTWSRFRSIKERLTEAPPDRTLRDDLAHLKRLGLIGLSGHGRGAMWFLKRQA